MAQFLTRTLTLTTATFKAFIYNSETGNMDLVEEGTHTAMGKVTSNEMAKEIEGMVDGNIIITDIKQTKQQYKMDLEFFLNNAEVIEDEKEDEQTNEDGEDYKKDNQ